MLCYLSTSTQSPLTIPNRMELCLTDPTHYLPYLTEPNHTWPYLTIPNLFNNIFHLSYLAWKQSPSCFSSLSETKSGVWSSTLRERPWLLRKDFLMMLPHSVWPWKDKFEKKWDLTNGKMEDSIVHFKQNELLLAAWKDSSTGYVNAWCSMIYN